MKLYWYLFIFILVLTPIAVCTYPPVATLPAEQQRYSLYVVTEHSTVSSLAAKILPDNPAGSQILEELNYLEPEQMLQPGDILTIPDVAGELTEPIGPIYTSYNAAVNAQRVLEQTIKEAKVVQAYRGVSYREYQLEATAYTNSPQDTGKAPGHPAFGITASGLHTDWGTVAVDPGIIPLGSALWIEGYGYAVATDVGGAIKGMKIDVYFPTRQQALEWGRKTVKVRVFSQ